MFMNAGVSPIGLVAVSTSERTMLHGSAHGAACWRTVARGCSTFARLSNLKPRRRRGFVTFSKMRPRGCRASRRGRRPCPPFAACPGVRRRENRASLPPRSNRVRWFMIRKPPARRRNAIGRPHRPILPLHAATGYRMPMRVGCSFHYPAVQDARPTGREGSR